MDSTDHVNAGRIVRAAIIGTGFVGPQHADAVRRGGIGDVVAIVGSDKQRVERRAKGLGIPVATTDLDAVIRDPDIDIIHICTRNDSHVDLALKVLAAGKHVIVEKPMASTVREAHQLIQAASDARRHAAVSFTYRGYPMVREARSITMAGELGEIRFVHGGYLQDWLSDPEDYSWRVEAGHGSSQAVADIGTHWFNTAEYVIGARAVEVLAEFRTFVPTRLRPRDAVGTYQRTLGAVDEVAIDAEDSAFILLRFDNGARGSCVISQVSPGRSNKLTLEVAGSRGTLAWDHEAAPGSIWIGNRGGSRLSSHHAQVTDRSGMDPLPPGLPEGWNEALRDLFIPIYAAIADDDEPQIERSEFPTFLDGLRAARFVEAALESSRTGAWTTVGGD